MRNRRHNGSDPDPSGPSGVDPPARGFQVASPDVTIMPGQEITYCYYFHTPNTEKMVIKKWSSVMIPGSHHMIMYATTGDEMPPGTISTKTCDGFGGANAPRWTYSAQTPTNELALPTNDGTGLPLGQEIAPGTPAYFRPRRIRWSHRVRPPRARGLPRRPPARRAHGDPVTDRRTRFDAYGRM